MSLINSHGQAVIAEIAKSSNPVFNGGIAKAPVSTGALLKVKTDGTIKYRLVGNAPGQFDEDFFYAGHTSHERVIEVVQADTTADFKFVY